MKNNPNHKKIALFITDLGGGGAERVMLTLSESFAREGFPVDFIVSTARGALRADVPRGVRLIDLKASRLIKSLFPLARYLATERPSYMLSALSSANCVAIWARALSRCHTSLVVSEHTTLSLAAPNEPNFRHRKLPHLMRWSYPFADAVATVSNGVADDLARVIHYPRGRIQVIYNPSVTPAMLAKSREPLDHPWFKPGEPPVVLGVGRLVTQKDFATLIRAFAILRKRRSARLMILGEGEKRQELATLIDELGLSAEVALPGFVQNPYKFMRAARVFALSSRWEGFATVIVEALACGTNVVSTDCPSGPAEILKYGVLGRLVPVDDPHRLAAAIAESLDAPLHVSEQAMQRFTPIHIAKQYLSALGIPAGGATSTTHAVVRAMGVPSSVGREPHE